MTASLQLNCKPFTPIQLHSKFASKRAPKFSTVRCSAAASSKRYTITLLPGDGIGPEVISIAKNALQLVASLEGFEFKFKEVPVGGAALDLTGVPLPEETLLTAKDSDAVLLGAIGGYKWDNNEKYLKPETGLLQLRAGLKVFANLRPATVLPQSVPEIHLFDARFKEHIGDADGARAALALCDPKTDSNFIESIAAQANLERRLGNCAAASATYKEALKRAREKQKFRNLVDTAKNGVTQEEVEIIKRASEDENEEESTLSSMLTKFTENIETSN